MDTQFQKIPLRTFPRARIGTAAPSSSAETRFWSSFKVHSTVQFPSVASKVFFSTQSDSFCVCQASGVHVYNGEGDKQRILTRGGSIPLCGDFRPQDSALLVSGNDDGGWVIYNMASGNPIRWMKEHARPVRSITFAGSGTVCSGSDDAYVKLFDVATGACERTLSIHTDYVRSVLYDPSSGFVCSGGYDHVVAASDPRMGKVAVKVRVGAPVEDLALLPGGRVIVIAAGRDIHLWDVVENRILFETENLHAKTITSICSSRPSGEGSVKILSSGIDQMVKVFDASELKLVHTMSFVSPVLSIALSIGDDVLLTSHSDGSVVSRKRRAPVRKALISRKSRKQVRGGTYAHFNRRGSAHVGASSIADQSSGESHFVVSERQRRTYLQPYEKMLKKFQFQHALDAALETRSVAVVAAVLEELRSRRVTDALGDESTARRGDEVAISGRNEEQLERLLLFLLKRLTDPRYGDILIGTLETTMSLYAGVMTQSESVDELLFRIRNKVRQELAVQSTLRHLVGQMELLKASSSLVKE